MEALLLFLLIVIILFLLLLLLLRLLVVAGGQLLWCDRWRQLGWLGLGDGGLVREGDFAIFDIVAGSRLLLDLFRRVLFLLILLVLLIIVILVVFVLLLIVTIPLRVLLATRGCRLLVDLH